WLLARRLSDGRRLAPRLTHALSCGLLPLYDAGQDALASHAQGALGALQSVHEPLRPLLFHEQCCEFLLSLCGSNVQAEFRLGTHKHKRRIQCSQIGFADLSRHSLSLSPATAIAEVTAGQGRRPHRRHNEYMPFRLVQVPALGCSAPKYKW